MPIKLAVRAAGWVVLVGLFSLFSIAQQAGSNDSGAQAQTQDQPQAQPPATQQSSSDKNADKNADKSKDADKNKEKDKGAQDPSTQGKVAGTSNDRLFYTLPNFLTLEKGGRLPPLTTKEKYKVVALGTFDPIQYPWWGLLSAIGQAENSEPGYGQGWAAYGKRYGTVAADSTIENFMVGAVFPSILHQDPRFYQSGQGRFFHRTGYAISRIFVTRTDSWHSQFNYSEIVGSAFAAAVSTYSYHPTATIINGKFVGSDRTLTNAGSVWATQVSLDTITLVVKEFWPDVHRKLRKHKKDGAGAASSQP